MCQPRCLPFRRIGPDARLRLFCFPYAGGGALIYRPWADRLGPAVDVCPVELPGRGVRRREPLVRRIAPLVTMLAEELRPALDRPFAFFGHSFGGLVAFELIRHLRRGGMPEPLHLFVSGAGAPHTRSPKPSVHDASEHRLRDRLRELKGTPEEILENDELMDIMMPIVRADLAAIATYAYVEEPPLACPISAFGGVEDDEVRPERVVAWQLHTRGAFSVSMLSGGHFFVHTAAGELLHLLGKRLDGYRETGQRRDPPDAPGS